jgi:hypothetical protein
VIQTMEQWYQRMVGRRAEISWPVILVPVHRNRSLDYGLRELCSRQRNHTNAYRIHQWFWCPHLGRFRRHAILPTKYNENPELQSRPFLKMLQVLFLDLGRGDRFRKFGIYYGRVVPLSRGYRWSHQCWRS